MSTRTRLLACAVLTTVFAVLAAWALQDPQQSFHGLALNLATEILGIVITLVGIDWLLERQQDRQRLRAIAEAAGRDTVSVVWLWLGGRRGFDPAASLSLLTGVGANHFPIDTTRHRLVELGVAAEHTRRTQRELLSRFRDLDEALARVNELV